MQSVCKKDAAGAHARRRQRSLDIISPKSEVEIFFDEFRRDFLKGGNFRGAFFKDPVYEKHNDTNFGQWRSRDPLFMPKCGEENVKRHIAAGNDLGECGVPYDGSYRSLFRLCR